MASKIHRNSRTKLASLRQKRSLIEQAIRSLETVRKIRTARLRAA